MLVRAPARQRTARMGPGHGSFSELGRTILEEIVEDVGAVDQMPQ